MLELLCMNQKTKIIATLGPASEHPDMIKKLIESGVNIFRFNLKHNSYSWHSQNIKNVKYISEKMKTPVGILADLQGPELRTGVFPNNVEIAMMTTGQPVQLSKEINLNVFTIPFNYVNEVNHLKKGSKIFIDDGKIELIVEKYTKDFIEAVVLEGGELGNRKSVSIPEATIDMPTLTEKDIKDVRFAVENEVDFIALSFVRDAKDINILKDLINKLNGKQEVIAKIETLKSIDNFDEILSATNGIMFARGDLGIEIPMERLPLLQKNLIEKCRNKSKPVIIATQMLQSMIHNGLPTRAEVADIANAVFDKTDAIMLSEETTIGVNPLKVVQTMARIARYNEKHNVINEIETQPESYQEVLISSSIRFIKHHPQNEDGISGFVVFTESGKSARMLSRFRTNLPIYAFTSHESTEKQLTMSYGVMPFVMKLEKEPVTNTKTAINILKKHFLVSKENKLIVIFGNNVGVREGNNNMSIVKV
jgi:pyruvate kinase